MVLLTLFALVAGAATAVTPCVLPVLPALLSASALGGRRRPLGIVLGLAITFTVAVVALASLVKGVGVAGSGVRVLAEVVLIAFGLSLLLPGVAARIEAPLTRLSRLGPRTRGSGFWSGLGVGGALGFAYTPCAGPILAAVISVSATQGTSAELVTIAVAYAAGSALVLLVLGLGGRRVVERVRHAGRGLGLQRAMGVVMVATAVAMATQLDVRLENALARHLPTALVDPANALETSHAAQSRLADLRGRPRFDIGTASAEAATRPRHDALPVLGVAPEFTHPGHWFNTAGRPLSMAQLRGRVVLIDFWTYTCINCIRTLPYLEAWDARYRKAGLTIVGVHTPEFPFERDTGNVAHAISTEGIRYPVVQDNDYGTWSAYQNQYWPAEYLVDAQGRVRYTHFGEGDYGRSERAIRTLLAGRGRARLASGLARVHALHSPPLATPETYVGTERAAGWVLDPVRGAHDYGPPPSRLPPNAFALGGRWSDSPVAGTALARSSIDVQFEAQRVYVVLGPPRGRRAQVRVLLDGRPERTIAVDRQRLYNVVSLPRERRGHLSLRFDSGISAYSFTFG